MSSSVVGNLIVRLAADIGDYRSGMKRAERESQRRLRKIERRVQRFERNFRRSMAAAAAGTGALSGALAAMVTRQAEVFKQTDATAQAIDLETGRLQELQYAFQRTGVSGEKTGDILKDVADKIGDAYANGTGEAIDVLNNLGLAASDLIDMSPDEQLLAIADAMRGMPRGAQVNALESMANDASRLLPLLKDGGGLVRQLSQEARDLDVSMDAREIEQMREANAAIDTLRGTYEGLAKRITVAATPAIRDFADTLMDEDVQRGLENMASGLVTIIDKLSEAVSWFARFGRSIGDTFGKMAAGAADPIERLKGDIVDLRRELDGLSNDDVFGHLGAAGVPGADTGPATGAEADRIRAEIDDKERQIQQLQKMRAAASDAQSLETIDVTETAPSPTSWTPSSGDGGRDMTALRDEEVARTRERIAERTRELAQIERDRKAAVQGVSAALATQQERALSAHERRLQIISQNVESQAHADELRVRSWQRYVDEMEAGTDQMSAFAQRAAENIQDQLGDTLESVLAGDFDSIADSWASMLRQMAAQAAAQNLAGALFGKEFGSSGEIGGLIGQGIGMLGGMFGPSSTSVGTSLADAGIASTSVGSGLTGPMMGFANGGRPPLNQPSIIGERGPEVWWPDSAGTVIPNDALSGGNSSMSVVVENHGPPAQVEQRRERGPDGREQMRVILKAEMSDMVQTGEMDEVLGDLAAQRQGKIA